MRESIRLGHFAGIRVGLNVSVLVIVLILVVGLSFGRFPQAYPDYATWAYIVAGVASAILLLASLLAHELAHAVVAQRNGIDVEGITLWLLGGVARLRGEAENPGMDFRIAAVGPVISLVLGVGFGVLAWATGGLRMGDVTLAAGVLTYLAAVNVLLALFNLIPAAPLDGGRILRSVLWAWRGDRIAAQIWAARAGRVFGFLLIGLGILQLVTVGRGVWWILIGLFVVTMASSEEQQARLGGVLGGLRVGDVMTPAPDTADGDQSVEQFLHEVALVRRHSAFPLLGPTGEIEGLVTLNRIRALPWDRRGVTRLREIACPPEEIPFGRPDEPLADLLPRLGGCTDGRALIVEDGRLVGIVSPSDVSRAVTLRGLGVGSLDGIDLARAHPWDAGRPAE